MVNDGKALEEMVASILRKEGKRKVETRKDIVYRSNGHVLSHNYDVVFYDHGIGPVTWGLCVAEVKCYTNSKVPELDINHYLGKLADNGIEANNASFYTISDYTRKARVKAEEAGLVLFDGYDLERAYHSTERTSSRFVNMLTKLCLIEEGLRTRNTSAVKIRRFTNGKTIADRYVGGRIRIPKDQKRQSHRKDFALSGQAQDPDNQRNDNGGKNMTKTEEKSEEDILTRMKKEHGTIDTEEDFDSRSISDLLREDTSTTERRRGRYNVGAGYKNLNNVLKEMAQLQYQIEKHFREKASPYVKFFEGVKEKYFNIIGKEYQKFTIEELMKMQVTNVEKVNNHLSDVTGNTKFVIDDLLEHRKNVINTRKDAKKDIGNYSKDLAQKVKRHRELTADLKTMKRSDPLVDDYEIEQMEIDNDLNELRLNVKHLGSKMLFKDGELGLLKQYDKLMKVSYSRCKMFSSNVGNISDHVKSIQPYITAMRDQQVGMANLYKAAKPLSDFIVKSMGLLAEGTREMGNIIQEDRLGVNFPQEMSNNLSDTVNDIDSVNNQYSDELIDKIQDYLDG